MAMMVPAMAGGTERPAGKAAMNEDPIKALGTSEDPKHLTRAAAQLAKSSQPSDHRALLQALNSEKFLLQLNAEEEYAGDPHRLRIRRILEVLEENSAPVAWDTILKLTKSQEFTKEAGRVDLLIQITAIIRPAPPELVVFWDQHSQPEDGFTPLTITALVENGSTPALELFERKMLDPGHEAEEKIIYFRSDVLTHRNSEAVIRSCERLLKGPLQEDLKVELIDALFDYKPAEWYTPGDFYNPPPLPSYSNAARQELQKLGQYLLQNVKLTKTRESSVRRTLETLNDGS
jgi:hypothetical protein